MAANWKIKALVVEAWRVTFTEYLEIYRDYGPKIKDTWIEFFGEESWRDLHDNLQDSELDRWDDRR